MGNAGECEAKDTRIGLPPSLLSPTMTSCRTAGQTGSALQCTIWPARGQGPGGRRLQAGSLEPCGKQSSLAWYWRGDRRIKPCSRDTHRPYQKQSPRSDLSPVPAKPGPSVLWTLSGAKEGKV